MSPGNTLSVFVVGTRAQLIKVAPIIVCCERAGQEVLLILTGQHKETMQDLVDEFGIRATPELAMQISERSTIVALMAWAPRAFIGVVRKLRALRRRHGAINVAVHGDTLSTVIGALAAKFVGAEVFHIESGLSSNRILDPFPEELTRQIVFRLTDVALCPGSAATLYMQSRHRCRIVDTVDNTIVDSVRIATSGQQSVAVSGAEPDPYLVVSLHRFQNIFDKARLRYLAGLIEALGARFRIHFVLHPATRKRLDAERLLEGLASVPNVNLSSRLGYRDFLMLASRAACVLTDGGSNQEELAVLGVPTIVMRERTERLDGLGQNAIMEADVGKELLAFMLGNEFESLRRASSAASMSSPSELIAAELAK